MVVANRASKWAGNGLGDLASTAGSRGSGVQVLFPSLALALAPQLPRVYQPKLVDPGLHGGLPAFLEYTQGSQTFPGSGHTPGDVTPDGRVVVLYRMAFDEVFDDFRPALQVAVLDPDFLQTDGGYLDAFLTQEAGPLATGSDQPLWGTDYAISSMNDSFLLHFSPPSGSGSPQCAGCPPLDVDYLPNLGGVAPLTLALKPLPSTHAAKGANPYPSTAAGAYRETGAYLTYELWMVTSHYPVDPGTIDCESQQGPEPDVTWLCSDGAWIPMPGTTSTPGAPILGARDLTVIVDLSSSPNRVHSATIGGFVPLEAQGPSGPTSIVGIEPSITADGRLLLFHADGGDNLTTASIITYSYNPDPCEITGWAFPKSITAMSADEDEDFKAHYALARQPIREPEEPVAGAFTEDVEFEPDDELYGAYPWVDKDGSFFMATHCYSAEGTPPNKAIRSSMIVCGEITNGYVKNVDDRALNPTRLGGPIQWPQVGVDAGGPIYPTRDSQMTTFFSTGLKPGTWEPFFDQGVPLPTMDASARIPILPVFVHRTRMYGEVRFEEADGNYILYLACNEAFHRAYDQSGDSLPSLADPLRTPDTSGRDDRPSCKLLPGASFPQEVWNTLPGFLAGLVFGQSGESHENLGFKGQGILFKRTGAVQVEFLPDYDRELTFQAFVKPMTGWNEELPLITDAGRFQLRLDPQGHLEADVEVEITVGGVSSFGTKSLVSTHTVTGSSDELDPGEGWIHVAAVLDGSDPSSFRLYLDGELEADSTWGGTTEVAGSSNDVYVGPRLSGSPSSTVLVLDEVAVSDVARTEAEIRRDAFVEPPPSDFVAEWPAEQDFPLPDGLDEAEVKWPVGVTYSLAKVNLGRELFEDPILSSDDTVACAKCHEKGHGFAESLTKAEDFTGNDLPFNTPSLLNAAFGTHKMFDGRAASLEDQVILPLTSGLEMGPQTINSVAVELRSDPYYGPKFIAAFGGVANPSRLAEALAMYQRTLNSGNAPFDQGDAGLSSQAEQGRALFFGKARCFSCHRGSTFSDEDFHNIHSVTTAETLVEGRGGFTGHAAEIGMLKTPTLRNIDSTGPYFHDGSKNSLHDVVDHYDGGFLDVVSPKGTLDRFILPLDLTAAEKDALVAFLESLSGTEPDNDP